MEESRPLRDVQHPREDIYEIAPRSTGMTDAEEVILNFLESGVIY